MITSILEMIYYSLKSAPTNNLFYHGTYFDSYYFYEEIRGLSGENNSLGTKIFSSLLFIQFHPLIDCLHKASFVSNLSLVIPDFPLGMPAGIIGGGDRGVPILPSQYFFFGGGGEGTGGPDPSPPIFWQLS